MSDQREALTFDGLRVPIIRSAGRETYLTFWPPDASMRFVSAKDLDADQIVAFCNERIEAIRDIRHDILKRFEKSPSLTCRYQTGDIAFLFGRPFVIRVHQLKGGGKARKGMRGRADVRASVNPDLSLIDLYVFQIGNYDQRRGAFLSYASSVYVRNMTPLLDACARRAQLPEGIPGKVRMRPMRSSLISIDCSQGVTWVSDSLIPYPPECLAVSFMEEACKLPVMLERVKTAEERRALFDLAAPQWQHGKELLENKESQYSRQ